MGCRIWKDPDWLIHLGQFADDGTEDQGWLVDFLKVTELGQNPGALSCSFLSLLHGPPLCSEIPPPVLRNEEGRQKGISKQLLNIRDFPWVGCSPPYGSSLSGQAGRPSPRVIGWGTQPKDFMDSRLGIFLLGSPPPITWE